MRKRRSKRPRDRNAFSGPSERTIPGGFMAVLVYRGMIEYLAVHPSLEAAERGLIEHLRQNHQMPFNELWAIKCWRWLKQREDRFEWQIKKVSPSGQPLGRVCQRLRKGHFAVLTINPRNPRNERYEAWLYKGPLNFQEAEPVRFGLGSDPSAALDALNYQLSRPRNSSSARPRNT